MSAPSLKSLTVRLKPELFDSANRLAKKREVSLNSLIQDSIARQIREQEDRELFEAFEELGKDPAACDVDYAFEAQAEVVLRG